MDAFKRYLSLVQEHPELFKNTGEPDEIKIILDPERILAEQKRIRAELKENGKPEHWIDIGVLSEDEWFWTVRDMVEFPDGFVWGYIREINRKSQEGGVGVVLMCVKDGKILLIRKFRHDTRDWSWEFPRGFGEPDKTAEANARTELREEVGVMDADLDLLAEIKEGNGGLAAYLVRLHPDQEIVIDGREGIGAYNWRSVEELNDLIFAGKIKDWFSLWAFTMAKGKGFV